MNFDFQAVLLIVTLAAGLVWLFGVLAQGEIKESSIVDYARSFFPILLIVLLLRSFLVEPFRIPSGSMEPTLYPGDFILVNKYAYGVHLPLLGTEVLQVGKPKRGDVVVFRYPKDPSLDYIKRVVGLPGDEVVMQGQELWVNGEKVRQEDAGSYVGPDERLEEKHARIVREVLGESEHNIATVFKDGIFKGQRLQTTVPVGHYFVMGDNRDNSNDSRFWGFVPQKNLVGRAFMIWMSWDSDESSIQWQRMGHTIQ